MDVNLNELDFSLRNNTTTIIDKITNMKIYLLFFFFFLEYVQNSSDIITSLNSFNIAALKMEVDSEKSEVTVFILCICIFLIS